MQTEILNPIQQQLAKSKSVYFIGIGGSSMSSLAKIAHQRGYRVAGSDMQASATTKDLTDFGITVCIGHNAENIDKLMPDMIVKTDAIADTNPELLCAAKHKIPVFRRAEFLGNLLLGYEKTVGVAGTHGKTTTTSMLTSVFLSADKNPSSIIGGHMKRIGASYRLGSKDLCVFESCEFKESYFHFFPDVSVILNIAEDHMEYFKTLDNLKKSFRNYVANIRPGGTLIYNAECPNSTHLTEGFHGNVVTFGLEKGDFTATNIALKQGLPTFDILHNGTFFAHVELSVPGQHNVKNALATAAAAWACGIFPEAIAAGLNAYNGAKRRFEYHCTVNGAIVADDYAHHPEAYDVTFRTARDMGFKRIIAIHQPHTFSRTKMLMQEFVDVLSTVDHVLIPPIYAARETNDAYNIYAEDVVARLHNAEFVPDFETIAKRIKEMAQPGDLFITLGCGDIYRAAELTTKLYGETIF